MKLEPPISNLIARCQTICVAQCCGIDAYDFSPIQIASYLTMWRGDIDEAEIKKIQTQLDVLKGNYATRGISLTIEEMNQTFKPKALSEFVDEIRYNLDLALELISVSNSKRYKRQKDIL